MEDQRIKKTTDAGRERPIVDEVRAPAEDAMVSVEERRKMFRELMSEVLPKPPTVPGWRFTWLSTTNQYDPIHRRLRMGYELVKANELPGLENFRVNSGTFEGCIQVNEMILAKLPEEVYQMIMAESHYYAPADEEQRLKANVVLPDEDREGRRLGSIEGDGYASINDAGVRHRRAPTFS